MPRFYHDRDCFVNTDVSGQSGTTLVVDTLAARLKEAREEAGMSQPELARAASVSQGTIGNIEAGLRTGSQSLAAIALALRVRYLWLRDGQLPKREPVVPTAWPFRRITADRWAELDAYERAAMEEAALTKLAELQAEAQQGKPNGTAS